jgi:hypothetical protein
MAADHERIPFSLLSLAKTTPNTRGVPILLFSLLKTMPEHESGAIFRNLTRQNDAGTREGCHF